MFCWKNFKILINKPKRTLLNLTGNRLFLSFEYPLSLPYFKYQILSPKFLITFPVKLPVIGSNSDLVVGQIVYKGF